MTTRWSMRDLVLVAVLSVVFGFLYWALVQAWGPLQVAMGPFGDLAQNVLIGGWMVVAPLTVYLLRRPFTGVVAEISAAFVEFAFLGSPVGPILLLSGFIQGAGAELPFALTRYRRFGWGVFVMSGLSASAASFVYASIRFGWWGQDLFLLRMVLHLLSGLLLTGVLARVTGDALARSGVVDDLPIGRDRYVTGVDR
ncbi:MAG: thiamine ABC transporter permease [Acidimicrobiia bacterium]|nr:thiamine ABC transporter permease [Acidimicrobiia bacterium]